MQTEKNKFWSFLLGFCILHMSSLTAQELTQAQQKYLEEIIEHHMEMEDNSPDLSTFLDKLNNLMVKPVNLNQGSKDEISLLPFLNDFQIASLLDYRVKNGPILTVYELQYIPGFRLEDVELIKPLVFLGERAREDSFTEVVKGKFEHLLVFRYQRLLEKQVGYNPIPDSILQKNPEKTRFLGSPDKLYCRYKLNAGGNLTFGLTAEKDPGEEFFRGTNKQGFDFYSAYLSYQNKKSFLRKLIIGDYHIRQGQGLLLWSSYLNGKSSNMDNIVQRYPDIIPSQSVEENIFFRGVAVKLCQGRLSFHSFFSYKSRDATLADSAYAVSFFRSFRESGIHATPSETGGEKTVEQTFVGSSIQYRNSRLKLGLNGYYTSFDKGMMEAETLYKAYTFTGSSLAGVSLDYMYLGEKFQFFGETARANQGYSTLNGLLVFLNSNILLGAIHRFYQPSYYSFYANAFAENTSISNEKGFFIGAEINFLSYLLKVYGDIFAFPWLKYGVDAPSKGNDIHFELAKQFTRGSVYVRYRRKESETNINPKQPQLALDSKIKKQLRLNLQYNPLQNLRVQNRLEKINIKGPYGLVENGYLVFQDLAFQMRNYPLNLAIRIAYFNTSSYNARIFAYEQDVRFAFSNQIYYGKGWRFLMLLRWNPWSFLTLWLRVGQSYYPGYENLGSGINTIPANHRTEIKIQSIFKL
jgi:hypothetical protein